MIVNSLQRNTDSKTQGDLQYHPSPYKWQDKMDFWRQANSYGVNGRFSVRERKLTHM